jgi:hypothetical protein
MSTSHESLSLAPPRGRATRHVSRGVLTRTLIACGFALLVAAVSPLARAQDDQPPAEEEKPREVDVRLKTIGSLGASHIYTSFGYIGTVADAVAKEVYPPERAEDLMREMIGMIDVNIANLREVRKTGLTESDVAAVDAMIEIYGLLKQEAQALSRYAKSRDREDAQAFEKARQTAWPRIARLLGLKLNDNSPANESPDTPAPEGEKPDEKDPAEPSP